MSFIFRFIQALTVVSGKVVPLVTHNQNRMLLFPVRLVMNTIKVKWMMNTVELVVIHTIVSYNFV